MTPSPIRTPAVGTLSLLAVIVWAIAGYVASAVGQDAPPTAPPFSDYREREAWRDASHHGGGSA